MWSHVSGSQVFRGLCLAREGLLFKKPNKTSIMFSIFVTRAFHWFGQPFPCFTRHSQVACSLEAYILPEKGCCSRSQTTHRHCFFVTREFTGLANPSLSFQAFTPCDVDCRWRLLAVQTQRVFFRVCFRAQRIHHSFGPVTDYMSNWNTRSARRENG